MEGSFIGSRSTNVSCAKKVVDSDGCEIFVGPRNRKVGQMACCGDIGGAG